MSAVTLPAGDYSAEVGGTVHVAVPGERRGRVAPYVVDHPGVGRSLTTEFTTHPPAWLEALNVACVLCEGRGTHGGEHEGATGWYCQECWGSGLRLFEIRTECDHRNCSLDKREQGIEWVCDYWKSEGLVPVPGQWKVDAIEPGDEDGYVATLTRLL